jgi:hypothetical protein
MLMPGALTLKADLSRFHLPPILLAAGVFLLALLSPVSSTNSDPRMGLLVSQNILETRSFRLDAYQQEIEGELAGYIDGVLVGLNDHIFYYFPIGTPIFFAPLVWLVNQFGWDMSVRADEAQAQNLFSALVAAAVCLVIYATCRSYLESLPGFLITAVTVLGSSLVSTASTALWNMDLAALFVALCLWLIARFDSGRSPSLRPLLLGSFLFAAYLCRPSAAVFVAVVLGYLLLTDRSAWLKTAVVSAGLLALFLIFSRFEYGQWLPPYYNEAGRFQLERAPVWIALYGNLLSPSRGLLIFSPFLIPVGLGTAAHFGMLKKRPLFWLVPAWLALLLLLLARSTKWWGGYAYGPRLLLEIMPGLALLTVLVWQEVARSGGPKLRAGLAGAYLILGLAGIWINTYQGLFNQYTAWWNGAIAPDVDRRADYLLNWEYPQFLATNDSLCRRNREYAAAVLADDLSGLAMSPYQPGDRLDYLSRERVDIHDLELVARIVAESSALTPLQPDPAASPVRMPIIFLEGPGPAPADVLFLGWSPPESGFRWSFCRYAQIAFLLPEHIDGQNGYLLEVMSGALDALPVRVEINGNNIGEMTFAGGIAPPTVQALRIPGDLLRPGRVNLIAFDIPAARSPGRQDPRVLGMSFVSLRLSDY